MKQTLHLLDLVVITMDGRDCSATISRIAAEARVYKDGSASEPTILYWAEVIDADCYGVSRSFIERSDGTLSRTLVDGELVRRADETGRTF